MICGSGIAVAWRGRGEPKRRIEIIESPTETCDQPDTLLSERGTRLVWSLVRYSTLFTLHSSFLSPPPPRLSAPPFHPMAAVGPSQQPPGSSAAPAPQPPPGPPSSEQITWEGDKMYALSSSSPISLTTLPSFPPLLPPLSRFNIYILDYCKKRGYHKTATQLVTEADIPPESKPPINAQQGLLFESVSSPIPFSFPSNSRATGGGVSSGFSFKRKTVAPVLKMQSSTPRSVRLYPLLASFIFTSCHTTVSNTEQVSSTTNWSRSPSRWSSAPRALSYPKWCPRHGPIIAWRTDERNRSRWTTCPLRPS